MSHGIYVDSTQVLEDIKVFAVQWKMKSSYYKICLILVMGLLARILLCMMGKQIFFVFQIYKFSFLFCLITVSHGGRQCAEFIHRRLHHSFRRQLFLLTGRLGVTTSIHRLIYDALFRAFIQTDRHFLRQQEQQNRRTGPGCAAIVVVILGDTLWSANCGDARAVLCRSGMAIALSSDHKPVSSCHDVVVFYSVNY